MGDNSGDLSLGYMMGQSEGNNNGGFGGMFGEGLWAIIILAMLGFGRGGFGGFGGGGFGGGDGVSAGFAWQGIDNGIRGIQQGLCDGFYAVNTGMLNGFHGVDNALCTLGYQTQQGFSTLGYQQKDCCCETNRNIDSVKYDMATGFCNLGNIIQSTTRDIIDNQNANYRGLRDFLVDEKIDSLRAENQALRFQASQSAQNAFITANQEAQTAELIRRLGRDCPVPAYVVPNPNCCYGNPVGIGYGSQGYGYGGNSCGCGCG